MDELVKNTFKNSFDELQFRTLLTELFDKTITQGTDKTRFIGKGYSDYINSARYYGNYTDKNKQTIGFYSVELKRASAIDRARTMQRNLIANFLRNTVDDCALVAFYEKEVSEWRLSYVKLDYEIDDKANIKEKLTPAKRHSFLIGPNEPNHTCCKQFIELLPENNILIEDIENVFSIENVTNEFFRKYKDLFLDLSESIKEICNNDEKVKEEFTNKHIKPTDFAKKLMGQLVFLYFLQKKGWLGVPKDKKWGAGPKNFMRKLFNGEYIQYNENKFFDDVLEPLFYQGLSEDVHDYHYNQFGCKIPFLNGGLFENINNYNWEDTNLTIKDKIFKDIFDTFDKFNFTIKENEPLEKEVAVDPEMLGKVFENLLEIEDRKSKGAFYTPRHIVHYICQQTLISYLKTNTGIPNEDITHFIERGHLSLDSIIKSQEENKKYGRAYSSKNLPHTIIENVDKIEELLKNVKVVDPAVGSGAFPVGMMNEIVQARQILTLLQNHEINLYDIKRETIENSLYGVDISNSATDITKLRFWLSLIVDEDDINHIRPLPNLDNQIMAGDSIIDGFEGTKLFNKNTSSTDEIQTKLFKTNSEKEFSKLEKEKTEFFNEKSPNNKIKLKKQINEIKWKYIEASLIESGHEDEINELRKYKNVQSRPFFIWELEFSEIFRGENPGFDIVIGNPPYVRQEKIKEMKPYLKEHYQTYTGVADLYVYFFEKGLNILKEKGSLAYICSNKFAKAKYGQKLRKLLLSNTLNGYNDYTGETIFKEASVDTSITIIKKEPANENHEILVDKEYTIPQNKLHEDSFIFAKPEILNLKEKIINSGTPIKDLDLKINGGILTGFNKAFIIDENLRNRLILEDKQNADIIRPMLNGKDISKWQINYKNLYIIFTRRGINIDNYPSLKKYLTTFKEELTPKNKGQKIGRRPGSYKWYEIRDNVAYYKDFEKPKLIYSEISDYLFAVYDESKYYTNKTCFIMTTSDNDKTFLKSLAVLMSSNLLNFVFSLIGASLGSDGKVLSKMYIEKLPIIKLNNSQKEILSKYYNSILKLNKKINNSNSMNNDLKKEIEIINTKINELVYEIYDLTPNEIEIIENNL